MCNYCNGSIFGECSFVCLDFPLFITFFKQMVLQSYGRQGGVIKRCSVHFLSSFQICSAIKLWAGEEQ